MDRRLRATRERVGGVISRFRDLSRASGGGPGGALAGRLGGLAAGAVGAGALGREAGIRHRYTQLGVEAGLDDATVQEHRAEIGRTAHRLGLASREVMDAIGAVVERTGDYAGAFGAREEIGRLLRRTGAGGVEIGETVSAARLLGIQTPKQIEQAGIIGVGAQRAGAMTLGDVARAGTPAIAAYAAHGEQGLGAWHELLTSLQVAMQATGSTDLAVGTVVSYLAELRDLKNDLGKGWR